MEFSKITNTILKIESMKRTIKQIFPKLDDEKIEDGLLHMGVLNDEENILKDFEITGCDDPLCGICGDRNND